MTEEQIKQKATESAKECFCYDSETYPSFERGFWEGVKYGATEVTKELQEEANKWKSKFENLERKCRFNFTDLLEDVEKEYKQDKQLTEAKKIIKNLVKQLECKTYFPNVERAKQFLKE